MMAKARSKPGTTKKRRKYLRSTCEDPLYEQLGLTLCGRFSEMDIGVLGLPEKIVSFYREIDFNHVSNYLDQTPDGVDHLLFVNVNKNEVLDTLDAFFADYFDRVKKAYEANPVPIYELIGIPDLKRYRNKSVWSLPLKSDYLHLIVTHGLERNGIISMYELLKLNLNDLHKFIKFTDDNQAREFLSFLKTMDVERFNELTDFCAPVDEDEEVPVLPCVPAGSSKKVSGMMDDVLAGDEVSLEGLSAYERALYKKAKAAVDICGSDFYFDVVDNPEEFRKAGKAFVQATGTLLEMMDRNCRRACLYNAVPEWIRNLPIGFLIQYCHTETLYDINVIKSYMSGIDPDLALEKTYLETDELLRSAGNLGDYDHIVFTHNVRMLDDIMDWAATFSIEGAVDECVYKLKNGTIDRNRWRDNPLITARASGLKLKPAEEKACRAEVDRGKVQDNTVYEITGNFRNARHNLFAAIFLTHGSDPVTKDDLEKYMSKEAAYMVWNAVTSGYLDNCLCMYSKQADAVVLRMQMYGKHYWY